MLLLDYWKYRIEPFGGFRNKIEAYYTNLGTDVIPNSVLQELIDTIAQKHYANYKRYWKKYPKSRKRYSEFNNNDLEHPFTYEHILNYFKKQSFSNYKVNTTLLTQKNKNELTLFEEWLNGYHTK